MYSVTYVIGPRTRSENACLCFSLASKAPTKKPWHREPDVMDPSRSVGLDLQDTSECIMRSVVEVSETSVFHLFSKLLFVH